MVEDRYEKKYICPSCFNVFRGKPKKHEINVPTGSYTTTHYGRISSTTADTRKKHTGNYWCGRCRSIYSLESFRQIFIIKGDRKKLNKITSKKKFKWLERTEKVKLIIENGVNFENPKNPKKEVIKSIKKKRAFCTECGSKLDINEKFCSICGSEIK